MNIVTIDSSKPCKYHLQQIGNFYYSSYIPGFNDKRIDSHYINFRILLCDNILSLVIFKGTNIVSCVKTWLNQNGSPSSVFFNVKGNGKCDFTVTYYKEYESPSDTESIEAEVDKIFWKHVYYVSKTRDMRGYPYKTMEEFLRYTFKNYDEKMDEVKREEKLTQFLQ